MKPPNPCPACPWSRQSPRDLAALTASVRRACINGALVLCDRKGQRCAGAVAYRDKHKPK